MKTKGKFGQDPDNFNAETDKTSTELNASSVEDIKPEDDSLTTLDHLPNTSLQQKCALCVPQISPELDLVIEAWPELPKEIREKIIEIVLQGMKNISEKG